MAKKQKELVVPSNPEDRKNLFLSVKSISDSMTRAKGESDYQTETYKDLSAKYNIDKKWIKMMVVDYHKQQFEEKMQALDDYSALYEMIVKKVSESQQDDDSI